MESWLESWWSSAAHPANGGLRVLLVAAAVVIGAVVAAIAWVGGRRQARTETLSFVLGAVCSDPVSASTLPPKVRRFFDDLRGPFRELGFAHVGDYRMVSGPEPAYTRFLAAPERDEFAEVSVRIPSGLPEYSASVVGAVSFVSVLSDGTYIETIDLELDANSKFRPPGFVYVNVPHAAPDTLLLAHREAVAKAAADGEATVLSYPPDQVVEVSAYYMRQQREFWTEQGMIPPPPGSTPRRREPVAVGADASEDAL